MKGKKRGAVRAFFCVFCGQSLTPAKERGCWECEGCRAIFRLTNTQEGCLVRVRVQECGTPACCQLR